MRIPKILYVADTNFPIPFVTGVMKRETTVNYKYRETKPFSSVLLTMMGLIHH